MTVLHLAFRGPKRSLGLFREGERAFVAVVVIPEFQKLILVAITQWSSLNAKTISVSLGWGEYSVHVGC